MIVSFARAIIYILKVLSLLSNTTITNFIIIIDFYILSC